MASFGHFALCRSPLGKPTLLDLYYGPDRRVERLEVLQKDEVIEERDELFRMAYGAAVPIADFMRQRPAPLAA
jgi:hypothetical protein